MTLWWWPLWLVTWLLFGQKSQIFETIFGRFPKNGITADQSDSDSDFCLLLLQIFCALEL